MNGLCNLSIQSVNVSVYELLSSLFISAELVSPTTLQAQIDSRIIQIKSKAPATLVRLLSLLQTTRHGNALVSTYGTNYQYIISKEDPYGGFLSTQAMMYDNECSCDLNTSCTSEAGFVAKNASNIIRIKGLRIGCTPSESFLASTLECFYNTSCVTLIQEQTHHMSNKADIPTWALVFVNASRFPIDVTVEGLVRELFVEDWSVTVNYSLYFNQCLPMLCSYKYIQQFNSLHTVTILIGLYSGVTIILKWFCPSLIHLVAKMKWHWQRRINGVEPTHVTDTLTDESVPTASNLAIISNITTNSKPTIIVKTSE